MLWREVPKVWKFGVGENTRENNGLIRGCESNLKLLDKIQFNKMGSKDLGKGFGPAQGAF